MFGVSSLVDADAELIAVGLLADAERWPVPISGIPSGVACSTLRYTSRRLGRSSDWSATPGVFSGCRSPARRPAGRYRGCCWSASATGSS